MSTHDDGFLEPYFCKKCGKEFYPTPDHVYKDYTGTYCCWTCFNYHRKTENKKFHRKKIEILTGGEVVDTYPSAQYAAKVFRVEPDMIQKACREERYFKGYHWRYAGENNMKGEN